MSVKDWKKIVLLRKEVEGMNKIMKSSQALGDMLDYHRSPSDKSGLGYVGDSSNKNENTLSKGDVKKAERNYDAPNSSEGKEKNQATIEEILLQAENQLQEEMLMMLKRQEGMVIIKGSQGGKTLEVHQGSLHLPRTKVHFLVIVILVQTSKKQFYKKK